MKFPLFISNKFNGLTNLNDSDESPKSKRDLDLQVWELKRKFKERILIGEGC